MGQQQTQAPTEQAWGVKELTDYVRGLMRDHMMEDVGEQLVEVIKRQFRELNAMTASEQRRHYVTQRAALAERLAAAEGRSPQQAYRDLAGGAHSRRRRAIKNMHVRFGDVPRAAELDYDGGVLAEMMPFLAHAQFDLNDARALAETHGRVELAERMNASQAVNGGILVDVESASDLIGALYSRTVVRRLGATALSVGPSQTVNLGKQNATPTVYWVDEGQVITASAPTMTKLALTTHKMGVVINMTNELVRALPAGYDAYLAEMISQALATAEDIVLLRGEGTQNTPKGVKRFIHADNVVAEESSFTLANAIKTLVTMMYRVTKSDAPAMSPGWAASTRTVYALMTLLNDHGYPYFLDQLAGGTLMQQPIEYTTAIPTDLDNSGDGNDNETELYFGYWGNLFLGEGQEVEVAESRDATISDADGNDIKLFQQDSVATRITSRIGTQVAHNKAFAICDDLTYGAFLDP